MVDKLLPVYLKKSSRYIILCRLKVHGVAKLKNGLVLKDSIFSS